jgi:hypothetical protein
MAATAMVAIISIRVKPSSAGEQPRRHRRPILATLKNISPPYRRNVAPKWAQVTSFSRLFSTPNGAALRPPIG